MIRFMITSFFCFTISIIHSQLDYEPSEAHPFGLPHPEAPAQLKEFQPMIGECKCMSTTRNQDGEWGQPEAMTWRFKYIMNGWGVQDETFKESGTYSGSIRQFDEKEGKWYVHYYSSNLASKKLSTWEGKLEEDKIKLYREQKAPNGMDGFYRLTFYDMSDAGYSWIGEWVSTNELIVFPTWKIECER